MSSSHPLSIPASNASSPLPPQLRNTFYSTLLSSGGIPAIQASLTHELQASGWTSNLRDYIISLLRSGECTTFAEVMERVLAETQLPAPDDPPVTNGMSNGVHRANGNGVHGNGGSIDVRGKSVEEGGIRIPERAIREGVRTVRRELEKVCDITVEGEEK